MKTNKICFSRTLVYLILLIIAVAGVLYGVNYLNSRKIALKSQAAGYPARNQLAADDICRAATGDSLAFCVLGSQSAACGLRTLTYKRYYPEIKCNFLSYNNQSILSGTCCVNKDYVKPNKGNVGKVYVKPTLTPIPTVTPILGRVLPTARIESEPTSRPIPHCEQGLDCNNRLEGENIKTCMSNNKQKTCCLTSDYRGMWRSGKLNCVKQNLSTFNCNQYGLYDISDDFFGKEQAQHYRNNYCRKINADNLYSYGGGWGTNATCYSKTKLCVSGPYCQDVDSCGRCINERVDINFCITTGKAPVNVFSGITCPSSGSIVHAWGAKDECYSINGGVKYSAGGQPYCANLRVEKDICCGIEKLFNKRICN